MAAFVYDGVDLLTEEEYLNKTGQQQPVETSATVPQPEPQQIITEEEV